MRRLTAGLMMLLAAIVVAVGGPGLKADCDTGECLDLADEVAFELDGANVAFGAGSAEEVAGGIDQDAVGTSLEANTDPGTRQEAEAEADRTSEEGSSTRRPRRPRQRKLQVYKPTPITTQKGDPDHFFDATSNRSVRSALERVIRREGPISVPGHEIAPQGPEASGMHSLPRRRKADITP